MTLQVVHDSAQIHHGKNTIFLVIIDDETLPNDTPYLDSITTATNIFNDVQDNASKLPNTTKHELLLPTMEVPLSNMMTNFISKAFSDVVANPFESIKEDEAGNEATMIESI